MQDTVKQSGRMLTIEHVDSSHDPALQQADLVAWAFLRKYEHGDESFAMLIQERVVIEKTVRGL